MDVRNCKKCGRIYVYKGNDLCPSCAREEDKIYDKVKEYIYDHPDANIVEVSEQTGVDEKIILKFLREGRLRLKNPGLGLNCERCGVPITTGRYCSKCSREIKEGLTGKTDVSVHSRGKNSKKMYTADIRKKRF